MRTRSFALFCTTLVLTAGSAAYAANCALRNPDRQIYEMFPEATNYRSLVGKVDASLKGTIEGKVGTPLALNDLGKHTLYVVMNKTTPIGFVHARSEVGGRGSVELVWALDMNLNVKDFRVQRSRERNTGAIKAAGFREHLVGKDLEGLQGFLQGSDTVNVEALGVPDEASSISHTAVLSGVKTVVITDLAFPGRPTP